MRVQMSVPLEFVESEIVARHLITDYFSIEDIEFDGLSDTVSVSAEMNQEEAYKIPWIDADDIDGVPV